MDQALMAYPVRMFHESTAETERIPHRRESDRGHDASSELFRKKHKMHIPHPYFLEDRYFFAAYRSKIAHEDVDE